MFALFVALSVLGLALGPALVALSRGRALLTAGLDGLALGIVPVLLVVRTLPHLYDEIGPLAIALTAVGYVALLVIERRGHAGSADVGIAIVLPALAVHSFLDGAALALAFSSGTAPATTLLLAGALVFHKLPEGLFFATAVVPRLGMRRTLPRVGVLAGATVIGALSGRELLAHAPDVFLHALVAAGLGVMLRLVVHRHDVPGASAAGRTTSGACFLAAFALALLVPSPKNILAEAQPRELSIVQAFVPLLVETAPAVLVGLVVGPILRALSARASASSCEGAIEPMRAGLDAGVIAFSWIVLGPSLTALRVAGGLLLTLAARRARHATGPDVRGPTRSDSSPSFSRRVHGEVVHALGPSFDRIAAGYVAALVAAAAIEAGLSPRFVGGTSLLVQLGVAALAGLVGAGPLASTLTGAVLVHKGLAVPAAVVLLLASQALPLERLTAIRREGGWRTMATYAAATAPVIGATALLAAFVVAPADLPQVHDLAAHRHVAAEWICAVAVLLLLMRSLVRQGPRRWFAAWSAVPTGGRAMLEAEP